MPEGPEARTMADMLNQRLQGRYLLSLEREMQYKNTQNILNWVKFEKLLPLKILKVKAKGKKVIWKFEGRKYLVTSLAMTGLYLFKKDKYIGVMFTIGDIGISGTKQIQLVDHHIYFSDKRNFAHLYFNMNKDEYKKQMKDVGFDLLNYAVKNGTKPDKKLEKFWLKRARLPKYEQTEICSFLLLKQNEFAGIGNYLKTDILFLAGIYPEELCQIYRMRNYQEY